MQIETGEERQMLLKRWKMGSWNGGAEFKVIDKSAAVAELQNDLKEKSQEVEALRIQLQKSEAAMKEKESANSEVSHFLPM